MNLVTPTPDSFNPYRTNAPKFGAQIGVEEIGPATLLGSGQLSMPAMQGTELAILMSGYVPSLNLPPDVPFIKKPFLIDRLIHAVEEILASPMNLEAGVEHQKAKPGFPAGTRITVQHGLLGAA